MNRLCHGNGKGEGHGVGHGFWTAGDGVAVWCNGRPSVGSLAQREDAARLLLARPGARSAARCYSAA